MPLVRQKKCYLFNVLLYQDNASKNEFFTFVVVGERVETDTHVSEAREKEREREREKEMRVGETIGWKNRSAYALVES